MVWERVPVAVGIRIGVELYIAGERGQLCLNRDVHQRVRHLLREGNVQQCLALLG